MVKNDLLSRSRNDLPKVEIIIVNYNGVTLLEKCLSSLINTNYPEFDIIVVDNNSSDASIKMLAEKFPLVKVIQLHENRGFAIANNIGAKNCTSKYIAFLNNDTFVTPNWLRELVLVMETDNSIVIAQPLLLRPNGEVDSSGDFATITGLTYNSKKTGYKVPREVLSARGAAMLVRRDFYAKEQGFDQDYFISFEDVEIGWKAWIVGFRVVMVPASIVYHEGGMTTKSMSRIMTFNGLKNQLSFTTTHFEWPLALKNLVRLSIQLSYAFLKLLVHVGAGTDNFTINKRAAIEAVFWYIKNANKIWQKHRHINSRRRRSTMELVNMNLITRKLHES